MSLVDVSVAEGVARVELVRPEARNALSVEMCEAIVAALEDIDRDPTARVVILSGAGSSFCSGADLAVVAGPDAIAFLPTFGAMLDRVARFRLPVIARIQGAALGGGFQLATACDLRIVAEDARLGVPAARLGVVVDLGNVQRLVLLVGTHAAREILLTARELSGREALDVGFATACVAGEALEDTADDLARTIAGLAPASVQKGKESILAVEDKLLGRASPDVDAEMANAVASAYASKDLQEGLRARAARETPTFRGS